MKLLRLRARNFKGLKDFTIEPEGKNFSAWGANGTFKTTLADTTPWLLFDKDSHYNSKFEIKTLELSGEAKHGLEHEVEGTYLLDNGKEICLRKVYKEKFTKKRGSATQEYAGNTTDYFVDGVPVKLKDYKEIVDGVAPEEVFKLLSSPFHFLSGLHWQERRNILLEVCGDVEDSEVIASTGKLKALPAILGSRLMEDHRKVVAARRATINKELTALPIRIDEVSRSLPDTSGIDVAANNEKIEKQQKSLSQYREELAKLDTGGGIAAKREELDEINRQIRKAKSDFGISLSELSNKKSKELHELEIEYKTMVNDVTRFTKTIAEYTEDAADLETRMKTARDRWHEIDGEELALNCFACGQALPEEKIQETKDKEKSSINANGKILKLKVEELYKAIKEYDSQIIPLETGALAKQELSVKLKAEIEDINSRQHTPDETLINKHTDIQSEIVKLVAGDNADLKALINSKIAAAKAEIGSLEVGIKKVTDSAAGEARIDQLKIQERELAAEYEKLEGELFLMDEFTKAKVGMLESKISDKFNLPGLRFKLFEVQVNGGISDVCEATYMGVPFNSGLNNGAKIKVGCAVIRVLQDHYNIKPVLWLDNFESVSEDIEMDCQVAKLYVSAGDDKLRVEVAA